jgi:hypothetical protein
VGIDAGTTISSTGGFNNTGLGYGVLANISFGSSNIAISNVAGSSYIATKTSNICIMLRGQQARTQQFKLKYHKLPATSRVFIE